MANQLFQSGGVFEITDHTTASDWERFIASLEETLTDWRLHKQSEDAEFYRELSPGCISESLWHERHETIKFGTVNFDIRYQYIGEKAKVEAQTANEPAEDSRLKGEAGVNINSEASELNSEDDKDGSISEENGEKDYDIYELPDDIPECVRDLASTTNDFASKAHCLVRWYNLRRFIILSPRGDTILTEDKIHNPKNHFYQGISEHQNIRTMYEMVFYKRNLKQFSYLSELISMFREKAGCNLNDQITATIRLNYCLDTFDLFLDPSEEFSGNEHIDDDQDESVKRTTQRTTSKDGIQPRAQDMRSGATFEQVVSEMKDCVPHPFKILRFLHVAAIWLPVSDKVITDTQVHSDLDPAEAPLWTIRCVTSDNCNMKLVHETQALFEVFKGAINYAYDKMNAISVFDDYDKEALESKCLRLCYDLATKPEVVLSERSSDSLRKLVALLFHRQQEITTQYDALDQLAEQVKKKPTLNEIFRNFTRKHRPSVKEFIIRAQVSRPFSPIASPPLPQRMFCTICDEEFRLCGAFSELCN